MKTCSRALRTSDWGEGSPSNRTKTLSTQPRQCRSGFGTSLNVLEWPSKILDLNPVEYLWRDLKIAVYQHSPSNLTELERICREEWELVPKYRRATLVVSYPRRLEAVISAKRASTKYCVKGLNACDFSFLFIAEMSKNLFLRRHYGVLCVD
uniref:Tc1-like transposase DDE domain-containing protein n=1 Tax=Oncorhynchus tshawytscha TaxID=74940 RepID=A0AAZ3RLA5_ONCTS